MEPNGPPWRRHTRSFAALSLILLAFYDLVIAAGLVGIHVPIVRPVVAFVLATVVVGGLFLLTVDVQPELRARWLCYSLGTGIIIFMALGMVLNLVLPFVGYSRPIHAVPLVIGLNGLVFGLAVAAQWKHPNAPFELGERPTLRDVNPATLVFVSLPLWTVLAVTFLNVTTSTLPITLLLILVAIVPIVVVTYGVDERYHPIGVVGIALAILWHKSLFVGHSYGGHVSVVDIWKSGYWPFSGETLAINAIFMPSLAHLTGLEVVTFVKAMMPVMVMFIPLAIYVTAREYTDSNTAFLAAALFAFSHPFYYQYPTTPRASMPVLFLALLASLPSDRVMRPVQRYALAILFAVGIITSHYGTSYYVMFALVAGYGLSLVYRWFNRNRERVLSRVGPLDEWASEPRTVAATARANVPTVTRYYVGFYVASVIAWYYFVDEGKVFSILVEHILNAYLSLFAETDEGGGATATRLATDYGGLSIEYSKHLYVLIAMLVGLGIAVVHWRRFITGRGETFDEEYLAIGSMILALFGGTLVISGEWGGGRPMMIVLSVNAVFAAVGMVWIARGFGQVGRTITWAFGTWEDSDAAVVDLGGQSALAVLLATFFVLNSGVMAAVAYGGEAPSEVPHADLANSTSETDLMTHAWVTDSRSLNETIYGDRGVRQEATDWRNGEIDAITQRDAYRFHESNDLDEVNESSELTRGYLILLGHNVVSGIVDVNFVLNRPIEAYDLGQEDRHLVYSNGKAEVYYTDQVARQLRESPTEEGAQ